MRIPERGDHPGVAGRYEKVLEPQVLETMRRGFNVMNRFMVPLWRVGLGRMMNSWPEGAGAMLVLEHVGRNSGRHYRTPLNFAKVGGDLYCVAAFGVKTHWYRNVLASAEVAVWLPDGRWVASAEDASDEPERLVRIREVLRSSGFVAPMIGLDPRQISDEDLDKATAMYRLLRIHPRRLEASTDGPGSLAWIWSVLGAVAITALVFGPVRRGLSRSLPEGRKVP